jgi:3-deoxy-D-manno-octulosonic-acid transferase
MVFYTFVYSVLYFLLRMCNPLLSPKLQRILADRKNNFTKLRRSPEPNCIWVHAASGEVEYAKPLLRELKRTNPSCYILLTYFSPSALKLIESNPDWDALVALPIDLPSAYEPLFQQFKPAAILYSRTDVWPNLAHLARKKNIPQLLFSATLADSSSRLKYPGRWLTSLAFKNLDAVYCVSENDLANFNFIKKNLATVQGDTRYDQVFYRLSIRKEIPLGPAKHPRWILGSTWPQDEAVILKPLVQDLINQNIELIVAPHEIDRVPLLKKQLEELGASVKLWSERGTTFSLGNGLAPKEVLLVDQIGSLAELYLDSDIAFVGGSFKAQVHSVMEPLAAGLPVIVGPYFRNNREACEYLGKFVFQINSSTDLKDMLIARWPSRELIRTDVSTKTQATSAVLKWLNLNKVITLQ